MNKFKLTIDPYSVTYCYHYITSDNEKWIDYINSVSDTKEIINKVKEICRKRDMFELFSVKFGIFFSFDDFVFECNDNIVFKCISKTNFEGYIDNINPYLINTGDGDDKYTTNTGNMYYNILDIIDYTIEKNNCNCIKCKSYNLFMNYSVLFAKHHYTINKLILNETKATLPIIDDDCHNYIIYKYMIGESKEIKDEFKPIYIPIENKLTIYPSKHGEKDNRELKKAKEKSNGILYKDYNYTWMFKVVTYYNSGDKEEKLLNASDFADYNSKDKYGFFISFDSELFNDYIFCNSRYYHDNRLGRNVMEHKTKVNKINKIAITLLLSSTTNKQIFYQSEEVIVDKTLINHYIKLNKIEFYYKVNEDSDCSDSDCYNSDYSDKE